MKRYQIPSSSCRFSSWLAVLLITAAHALEVTPNSPCASLCLNNIQDNPADSGDSSTKSANLVCDDWELEGPNSTVKGRKWKECLSCEQTSTASDAKSRENDAYWLLFHMKFNLDWCVFGYPDNNDIIPANQKCAEVCAGPDNSAKNSLTDQLMRTDAKLQYLYCDGLDIQNTLDNCAACLETVPNVKVLRNYAETLNTACMQKPDLGQTVKIDFDLFPPAATSTSVPPPARTETATVIVTLTPVPLSSSLPWPAAISAASASAVASSKALHDKNVRVRVGVGVSVGALLATLAVVCLVLVRRRSKEKTISEAESRARWEREYQAGKVQEMAAPDHPPAELGDTAALIEADDGRPREVLMLENRMARGSPGTFLSTGGGGGGGGGGSRTSRSGLAKTLGTKPAVPAKD